MNTPMNAAEYHEARERLESEDLPRPVINKLANLELYTKEDTARFIKQREEAGRTPWFSGVRNLGRKTANEIHRWLGIPATFQAGKTQKPRCPHCDQVLKLTTP